MFGEIVQQVIVKENCLNNEDLYSQSLLQLLLEREASPKKDMFDSSLDEKKLSCDEDLKIRIEATVERISWPARINYSYIIDARILENLYLVNNHNFA